MRRHPQEEQAATSVTTPYMASDRDGSLAAAGQRQWRDYVAQQCDSRAANNFMRVPTALTPGEDSSVRVRAPRGLIA